MQLDSSTPNPTQPLRGLDVFDLQDRLQALFSEHGHVVRLDLVRADQAGRRRFLVFVRMKTAQQDHALASALGLGRFGGDLVMLVSPDEGEQINPPWLTGLPVSRAAGQRAQPSPWSM
jgi:hypothetical protein